MRPWQEAVQLHQLHAACQSRIRYQKVCPQHGAVPNDQIVMGYEQAPQQHVVIDLAELDRLDAADVRGIFASAIEAARDRAATLAEEANSSQT